MGVILVVKNWKFRGGGGGLHEIPSVVGVWIFSGTTQYTQQLLKVAAASFCFVITCKLYMFDELTK